MGMFDKIKQVGELKKMRDQAMALQKQLAQITTTVEQDGIKIVVTGDQKIQELTIDGAPNKKLVDALNKAMKKSQETAAKKMSEMSGGLSGLMKGLGN